jgi:DNA-binding LacI/PurR family transcriptional regulator
MSGGLSLRPSREIRKSVTMKRPDSDKRRVQMLDIARLAGVSTSTVSRALNGSGLINTETRQRITELARSLNYSINVSAKNLRLGENRTIGVVIPYDRKTRQHVSDPFFLGMLGSLADALTDRGYDMLLSRVDAEHLDDLAGLYDTGRASGIVVIGQWGHHDQLNELAVRRVPFVVWGAQLPRQLYCSVGTDNFSGGRMAARYLLDMGRRRIAFMGDVDLPEAAQRHEGYLQAHRDHGLQADPALLIRAPFTAAEAQVSMGEFLARGLAIDGLFAASDLIAMNAMGVLFAKGLDVPRDVSVVGYDDIEAAAHCHPPLTTVRQPIELAGVEMVDCLLQVPEGKNPESRILAATLQIRGTTCLKN